MTVEIIERNAEILFNKLVANKAGEANISLIITSYIGACCVLEDIPPTELILKFLTKLKKLPKPINTKREINNP